MGYNHEKKNLDKIDQLLQHAATQREIQRVAANPLFTTPPQLTVDVPAQLSIPVSAALLLAVQTQ